MGEQSRAPGGDSGMEASRGWGEGWGRHGEAHSVSAGEQEDMSGRPAV